MDKKLNIAIFSYDTGPADSLAIIIQALIKAGHYVTQATLGGYLYGDLTQPRPDVILTNMASHKNESDFSLLQQASSANPPIPLVYLADTFTACVRPAFANSDLSQAIAIVAGKMEIEIAKKFGYKDAVFLGGPPAWQAWNNITPATIKRRSDDEKIIVVGGVKNGRLTNFILRNTITALNKTDIFYRLIFRLHRREDPATIDQAERDHFLSQCRWETLPEIKTEEIVAAADLGIFAGGTTVMIISAYARTPAISLRSDELDRNHALQSGPLEFYPIAAGAVASANASNLSNVISDLLGDGAEKLRQRQIEIFPISQVDPSPEERIVNFLEERFS